MTLPYMQATDAIELGPILAASEILDKAVGRRDGGLWPTMRTALWDADEGELRYGRYWYAAKHPIRRVSEVRIGGSASIYAEPVQVAGQRIGFEERPSPWFEVDFIPDYGREARGGALAAAWTAADAPGLDAQVQGTVVRIEDEIAYRDADGWVRGAQGTDAAAHAGGTAWHLLTPPRDVRDAVETVAAKWIVQIQKAGDAALNQDPLAPAQLAGLFTGLHQSVIVRYRNRIPS